MGSQAERAAPKTVGELRRRLNEMGNPWQVNPELRDDDPIPDLPRGGQREEDIPPEHRLKPLPPGTDLTRLIAEQPPANPFLRARWAEAGLLTRDQARAHE